MHVYTRGAKKCIPVLRDVILKWVYIVVVVLAPSVCERGLNLLDWGPRGFHYNFNHEKIITLFHQR